MPGHSQAPAHGEQVGKANTRHLFMKNHRTISYQPQALVSPAPGLLSPLVAIKPNSLTEAELGTCL